MRRIEIEGRRNRSSVEKGAVGEEQVFALLQARFPYSRLDRCSLQGGHQGDLAITLPGTSLTVMIEVKNLRQGVTVPPDQVLDIFSYFC